MSDILFLLLILVTILEHFGGDWIVYSYKMVYHYRFIIRLSICLVKILCKSKVTSLQKENNQGTNWRKKMWFNPQYSRNVKTNIGKISLCLLVTHFKVNNKIHKTINKNNVKASYS